ncbi:shikimate kinase [Streptantibioticus ferralitis]
MSVAREAAGGQPEHDPQNRRAGGGSAPGQSPGAGDQEGRGPVVVLVGPPGAGKSTIGRVLAERLGTTYRDTDADIEAEQGRAISDIFVEDGEAYFRRLERAAVHAALTEHPGVLSLGGGSIMDEGTREALLGRPVVFLDVSLAAAVHRVGLDAPRPLLAVNPRRQWRELMERRRPLYTQVARVVVSTDDRTPQDVADQVVDVLELRKV